MSSRGRKVGLVAVVLVILWIADIALHASRDSSPFFGNATFGFTLAQAFAWSRWLVIIAGGIWAWFPVLRANAKNITLSVVTTFIVLLLVEAVVVLTGVFENPEHAALHQRYFKQYHADSTLGFALNPNLSGLVASDEVRGVSMTIDTDAKGFRNVGKDYSKGRVMFIGDSFLFGAWVTPEESFFGRMDKALGGHLLNFGVGGYAMEQYHETLNIWRPQLDVDTVVICLFANDLGRQRPAGHFENYYEATGIEQYRTEKPPVWERTFTHKIISTMQAMSAPKNDFGGSATLSNGSMVFKKRGAHPGYFEQELNTLLEERVALMLGQCRSAGIVPVLVMLPTKELVYRTEYEQAFPDNGNYLDIEEQGYANLCQLATRFDAPCVNLTEAMRTAAQQEDLFFQIDGHYNPAGHAVVARELLKELWK